MEIEFVYSFIVAFLPREDHVHFAAISRNYRFIYEKWKKNRLFLGKYWLDDTETHIVRAVKSETGITGRAGVAATLYNTFCSQLSLSIIVPIYYWRHTSNVLLQSGFVVQPVPGAISSHYSQYVSPIANNYYKKILDCYFSVGFVRNQASILRAAQRASCYSVEIRRENGAYPQYISIVFDIGDCYDEMAIMRSSRQIFVTSYWYKNNIRNDANSLQVITLSSRELLAVIRFNDLHRLNAGYSNDTAGKIVSLIEQSAGMNNSIHWRGIVVLPQIVIANVASLMMSKNGDLRIYVMDETENDIYSCIRSMNIPPSATTSELIILTPTIGRAIHGHQLEYPFHFALDFCNRNLFSSAIKTIYCPDDPFDAFLFRLRYNCPKIETEKIISILSNLPGLADRGYHWTNLGIAELMKLERVAVEFSI